MWMGRKDDNLCSNTQIIFFHFESNNYCTILPTVASFSYSLSVPTRLVTYSLVVVSLGILYFFAVLQKY